MRSQAYSIVLALAASITPCTALAGGNAGTEPACHVGAYRLADGEVIDINASSVPGVVRWHRVDGRTGSLARSADGMWRGQAGWTPLEDPLAVRFGGCGEGWITFDNRDGTRVALDVTDTRFAAEGVTLRGRLVMPEGGGAAPVVVLVHGSERYSGVDYYHLQHLFPAKGIGVFVYDKRGTGGSDGKYTQDFDVLAGDAVSAMSEARRLGGARVARIGLHGSSQGGWVAPLAATRTPTDFLVVAYGLAESPAAEDRGQVMQELAAAGYGAPALAAAREVTDATARVMATRSAVAFADLRDVRRRHRKAPWWPVMQGEYTGSLLRYPTWVSRLALPWMDKGTPWDHDPMPVLRAVTAPQMWIIAEHDTEAPPAETLRRLAVLASEGKPITTVVFPDTEHGIAEFTTAADGTRTRTRYADGYLSLSMDFIRDGTVEPHGHGRARVTSAKQRPDPTFHATR
ncbi:alpha/beta hydrolase family protein [Lysobacter sp. A3-1-A15]|uniref:alpha/beta hydrolase family protein n=1 Tax=Novilysobacter viscosus TaxID=3098602 RepID=UPI002ED9070B